jgi:hypothetical protein
VHDHRFWVRTHSNGSRSGRFSKLANAQVKRKPSQKEKSRD